MERTYRCEIDDMEYTGDICPACKERKEREMAAKMNSKAVDRIKKSLTVEESIKIESIFFEDDAEVKLRDGKTYKIPPSTLGNARKLMRLLKTVNVDVIMMNFIPSGDSVEDEELDEKRIDELYGILEMAFVNYPNITRDYLDKYVDVVLASEIIGILIGLNGIKK